MKIGDFVIGSRIWVAVDASGTTTARGRLSPRLVLPLNFATPNERIKAELRTVRLQLSHEGEVIGETLIIAEAVNHTGLMYYPEVPVTHAVLEHITGRLGASANVSLELRWYGQIAVTWHSNEQDRRFMGDPEPGVETVLKLNNGVPHNLQIPRTDWYAGVLSPTRNEDYLFLEVAVPRGEAASIWINAFDALCNAEKSFALGDDPGVFLHLRGAFDALPGAKQKIVEALAEPRRSELNKLIKSLAEYLHSGRHVAVEGPAAGTFPVDHQDAAFAINMMKTLLAYLSQVLPVSSGE